MKKPSELAKRTEPPPLVAKPQRLGILPTMSFWNNKENWRPVRWPMGAAAGVLYVVGLSLPISPLGMGLFCGGSMYFLIGITERLLRRHLMRRRERYEMMEETLQKAELESSNS